jgi:Sensors of blue-light using FAD
MATVAPVLEGLLYRSRIVNRIGPLHMLLLVERARRANLEHDITGQLLYFDHSFMQYLEGPAAEISALWRQLQQDPRHYDVELLARYPLAQRQYPGSPLLFSGHACFGGYQLSGFSPVQPEDMDLLYRHCLDRWRQARHASAMLAS